MILGFSKQFPWGDPTRFVEKIKNKRKIHTLRADPHRRWREGMKIHFATGVRTPEYNQFHSGVCTGVQEISIRHHADSHTPDIIIDGGAMLTKPEKIVLAFNDGFDSYGQFLRWFDEDFEGRIIHWAGYEY